MGGAAVGIVIPARALMARTRNPEVVSARFSDVQLHIVVRTGARPGMVTTNAQSKNAVGSTLSRAPGPLFAVMKAAYVDEMSRPKACAVTPFGRTVAVGFRPIL
jgi:hypothetical protein